MEDFWWEVNFGSCTPYADINRDEILNYQLGETRINGSDNQTNDLLPGSTVIYKTKEGRYGKLEVLQYGYDLQINWTTFDENIK